jgi:deoxyribodipyrimidine photo-lyase
LVVAHGKPEDIFAILLKESGQSLIPRVFCQEEVCSEELTVDKAVRSSLSLVHPEASLERIWGSTLYDPDDLPFNDGPYGIPDTFTPFRNKVEKKCQIGRPLPVANKSSLSLTTDI